MHKLSLLLIFSVILSLSLAHASLINGTTTGSNSETYTNNQINLTENFFAPQFNVTQIFTISNGKTVLWIPWYTSSSSCGVADLHTDDIANASMVNNTQVTDEFSEVGLLLAMTPNSISATRFNDWYNTVIALQSTHGQLPCWKADRNLTDVWCNVTDTASDASTRIITALYIAANNSFTSPTNAVTYTNLANNLSSDHLHYEVWQGALGRNVPFGNNQIQYWLSGGTEGIAAQGNSSNPFIWTGYFRDGITAMLAAYANTGNATYLNVANDYVSQYLLATNYTGGTSGSSFKVAPFDFAWNFTANPPRITAANTFYFNASNTQWDDSDAPRTQLICDTLRMANFTLNGTFTAAFTNLSTYCQAWVNSATFTNTTSCLQYYYNGTCATTIRTGFYENGLGWGTATYYNSSFVQPKVNEFLTHYSWSGKTYDSAACYGIYRGVRPDYALGMSLGLSDATFKGLFNPISPVVPPSNLQTSCTSMVNSILGWILLTGLIGIVFFLGLVITILAGWTQIKNGEALNKETIVIGIVTIIGIGFLLIVGIVIFSGLCIV